jgi:hypothetical protein
MPEAILISREAFGYAMLRALLSSQYKFIFRRRQA